MTAGDLTAAPGAVAAAPAHPDRKFKVMLVDLDDTLYRVEEVPKLVKQKIEGEEGHMHARAELAGWKLHSN